MKWRQRRKTEEWFQTAYPGATVPADQDSTWAIYKDIEAEMTALENKTLDIPEKPDETQPYFMPMMVSAPPRKGKSALTLMLVSLAVKMGFNVFFSVAPNKLVPLREMIEKIEKMGWKKLGFTYRRIDDLWKQAAANVIEEGGDALNPDWDESVLKEACLLARS